MRKLLVVFVGMGMLTAAPALGCTVAENVTVTASSQQVKFKWLAPNFTSSPFQDSFAEPQQFHVRVWKTNEESNWYRNPGVTVSREYAWTPQLEKERSNPRELPKERMAVTYKPEPSGEYRAFFSGQQFAGAECWEMTKEYGPLVVP